MSRLRRAKLGRLAVAPRRLPWATGLLVLVAVSLAAPPLHADESRGIVYTRRAQAAMNAGELEEAIDLLQAARVEWPGAPEVAHTLADAYARQGNWAAALGEYAKGAAEPLAWRSYFNQGVTRSEQAEQGLAEAGVPLDPAGLPEDVAPGPLIEAIDQALPQLERARANFLSALDRKSDKAARESVAALNRRMDELKQMREELEQRQQEEQEQQQGEDDQQQEGEDGESDENQDGENQDQQDQQDPSDGEQQSQDQQQEGEDEQQDQDEQEGEDEQQPDQPEPQPSEGQEQPAGQQEMNLTPEQMQQLLDQLEQLEERAQEMARRRRAAQRKTAEKDW